MKLLFLTLNFTLAVSCIMCAQHGRVVGFWLTEDSDSQIEIFQVPGKDEFKGRIVWLEEPFEEDGRIKVDENNPDRNLRNRRIMGLEILSGLTYNPSKQEWENGRIYDPKSGRTYNCYMWLDGNNTLRLKGFVLGMRFLGRETRWVRETELRK